MSGDVKYIQRKKTYQNDGQEGERSRPDTSVHREYGEALQNVCRTFDSRSMIRWILVQQHEKERVLTLRSW